MLPRPKGTPSIPSRGERIRSSIFDAFVSVCDSVAPCVQEITYDTAFRDGCVLGTVVHRTAKLGDGLVNFSPT